MSTFQMLLVLGAIFILSLIILNINKRVVSTDDVMYDSNFGIIATSIATSIIEEASQKHFDALTDTTAALSSTQFTVSGSLGIESGEDTSDSKTFNDFDDYNNYSHADTTILNEQFKVRCKVVYVNANGLDSYSSNQTWHKKLTVSVSHPSMQDTISQSTIFSYWNFR